MPTTNFSVQVARTMWDDARDLNSAYGSLLKERYAHDAYQMLSERDFIDELMRLAHLKAQQRENELLELRMDDSKPHLVPQESSPTTVVSTSATAVSAQLQELWKSLADDINIFNQLTQKLVGLRAQLSMTGQKVDQSIHKSVMADLHKSLIADATASVDQASDLQTVDTPNPVSVLPVPTPASTATPEFDEPDVYSRRAQQPILRFVDRDRFKEAYAYRYLKMYEAQKQFLPEQDHVYFGELIPTRVERISRFACIALKIIQAKSLATTGSSLSHAALLSMSLRQTFFYFSSHASEMQDQNDDPSSSPLHFPKRQ